MQEAGIKPNHLIAIPETALQARAEDGLHLVRCSDGVEGQFWSNGELESSRWWAQTPSPEQWVEFCRASGVGAPDGEAVPAIEQPELCARPWTNTGRRFEVEQRARQAAVGGAVLLLAAYGYFSGGFYRDLRALWDAQERLAAAQQQSAPVLANRDAALDNLEVINATAMLDPFPAQLTLFARVADKLPANGAQLTNWSYRHGELQFTIFSPASPPDVLFYVKNYSMVDGFADVTADRAVLDRSLRVRLRVAKR